MVDTDDDNSLVVLPLTKAFKESTLNQIKEKFNHLNISNIK
ncbi:hypothetical protein [Staphylococcus hominis]|nr:hypothetical protein [Staphylococcus hominis]